MHWPELGGANSALCIEGLIGSTCLVWGKPGVIASEAELLLEGKQKALVK